MELSVDEHQIFNGARVTGTHELGSIREREGFDIIHGETLIEAGKRGGRYILRPRHPQHPLLQNFDGVPTYAPDLRWRIAGAYKAFETPRPTRIGAAVAGIEHIYEASVEIAFWLDGATHQLTAFNGHAEGSLNILFTDATSGKTTYGANRSLNVEAPAADGSVVLDFNRALNLPCTFTDLATCPLPPAENRLRLAVKSGEKTPYERLAI